MTRRDLIVMLAAGLVIDVIEPNVEVAIEWATDAVDSMTSNY
jgi:hypothetical protein